MAKRDVVVHSEAFLPDDEGIDCSVEESMTQQEFRDECDINVIMRRYDLTRAVYSHESATLLCKGSCLRRLTISTGITRLLP